jgi:hypothetical protein
MPAVAADRRALLTRVAPKLNAEVEDFCRAGEMTKTDGVQHLIKVGLRSEARRRKRATKPESAITA